MVTYIGHSNSALVIPSLTTGVTNAANLGDPIIGKAATLSSTAVVDQTFATATDDIRLVAVNGLVLGTGTPSISFAFSNIVSGGSELGTYTYTPSLTSGYTLQAWVLNSALSTAQYLRTTFTNCASVGIIWASPVFSPTHGIALSMSRKRTDLSTITQSSLSGAKTVIRRAQYLTVGVQFLADGDDDFENLDDMEIAAGISGQVLVIPDYGSTHQNRQMIMGRWRDLAQTTYIAPELLDYQYEIEQDL